MNSLFYDVLSITFIAISIYSLITQFLCLLAIHHLEEQIGYFKVMLDRSYCLLFDRKNNTQPNGTKRSVTPANDNVIQLQDGDHDA